MFRKQSCTASEQMRSLSLVAAGRTLDIVFETQDIHRLWVSGLEGILKVTAESVVPANMTTDPS